MHKEIHRWYSPAMHKDMNVAVYGHYGFALLMFPTAAADFLEYERFLMIKSISGYINDGVCKVFTVDGFANESWLNRGMYPPHKSIRHGQYNNYVMSELVPFIYSHSKSKVPIITTGASVGAYLAANAFFRRPDIIRGFIGMSGIYDLTYYFNSPTHYLPKIDDHGYLEQMRNNKGVIIASGQGDFEDPNSSRRLSGILNDKGIRHWLDLWGHDMRHDWPTWRNMLPHFLQHYRNI